jgi:hypothetical protein
VKLFSCQACKQTLFFESVQCTNCGHALAYLPDRALICAIEAVEAPGWRVAGDESGRTYRLCRNQTEHAVCNWAIPIADSNDYCLSCRLNHMIPNLERAETKEAWHRLEIAKRRVLYTLYELGLPVEGKSDRPNGLQFDFLQDAGSPDEPRVSTGHTDGVITINVAEAEDPFREKMRVQMGETYRTVLGHFRHEIGHYYWDRLIPEGPRLADFRQLFGDERADYAEAQKRHYAQGAPPDWGSHFVSAYASMHPWEDWAESWAHHMHIVDTLETAGAFSLSLRPVKEPPQPTSKEAAKPQEPVLASRRLNLHSFEDLIAGWIPLTMALNSLSRSMGMNDSYPFVLSETAIAKLRFVHQIVEAQASAGADTLTTSRAT